MVLSNIRPQQNLRVETAPTLKIPASLPSFGIVSLPNSPLFGTDGIRGKAGDLLTAPLALQVGFWAAQVLQQAAQRSGAIIIGQDSRNSSDMLSTAIAAGLTAAGLEVWNLGLCPTPCVSYLTSVTDAIGGVMISASHNPPEDNGIKFFSENGTKLASTWTAQIEAGLRGQRENSTTGETWGHHYQRPTLAQEYTNALLRSLPQDLDLSGQRVVLDLAWGAATQLAPIAFEALGAEVICLHDQANGNRINVNCGSTHLEPLKAAVQLHEADLGFAFDGDADRVMAVDSQGRTIDGDYILYFWGKSLKKQGKLPQDMIVATVMANLGFERAWKDLGGQFCRTQVGDRYVQAEMFNTGAMLGGEQSGHILCHHHSYSGDGLQTALHLTALTQEFGHSLAEMVDNSFQTYPQLLQNVRVEDRETRLNWEDCDALQSAIATAENAMGNRGRILVRASGTEPVIRVMVEAENADMVQHWTQKVVKAVETYLV
ncbi:MAG: phosphoglucosamine mutase [Jaaginema sp. PMC 1079.18]|nr:phosphoglucosamine mutase [Jaaginema sp. PMC 1080.18]MEC4851213.1 phosphoglucosamine mutase [Jaaginema sp. PMC 1079.18]MEC4865682.1 phosphoglucosamine mutase [Jaaginema sp. PMC 1078.18]